MVRDPSLSLSQPMSLSLYFLLPIPWRGSSERAAPWCFVACWAETTTSSLYNQHEKLIYETLFLSLLCEMDMGQEIGSKECNAINASLFEEISSVQMQALSLF